MQVNLSAAYMDQLVHLFKKVGPEATIYNFDNDTSLQFSGTTINYAKSRFPKAGIVNTMSELGKVNNIKIVDYNDQLSKADGAMTNGRFIENTVYFIDRFRTLLNSTKSSGFIAVNLPVCYNSGFLSYQPNLFKEIAKQNEYGLTFFRISDYSGNYTVPVDVDINNHTYKELMHKYQHTADVRLGVTFKKDNNTAKFEYKENDD